VRFELLVKKPTSYRRAKSSSSPPRGSSRRSSRLIRLPARHSGLRCNRLRMDSDLRRWTMVWMS